MNILQEPVQFKDTTDYNNEPLQYTDVNPQEGEMALVEPSGYALKHRYGEYGYQDEDDASNIDTVCTVITRARENRKNSRSGPKLRILDRFQTPRNANKSVQQVLP